MDLEAMNPGTAISPTTIPQFSKSKPVVSVDICEKSEPTYRSLVKAMSRRYPNLSFLSYELNEAPRSARRRGRAAAVEYFKDRVIPVPFESPESLQTYIKDRHSAFHGDITQRTDPTAPDLTLFILEDIATDYVEALGLGLRIEPFFFAKHLRTTNWVRSVSSSGATLAPSLCDVKKSFSLQYPDVCIFTGEERRTLFDHKVYCQGNVFRRVAFPGGTRDRFDGVGVVSRRVSYWSNGASLGLG
jgi:hypothetical protein